MVVGADRIAANGDVANKIGTYSIAVLAKENSVPFYVAAPISTLDLSLTSGDDIPIEERDPREVLEYAGVGVAPEGVKAAHPGIRRHALTLRLGHHHGKRYCPGAL